MAFQECVGQSKNNEAMHVILHLLNFHVESINQLLSSAKGNKVSRLKQQLLQQLAKLKGNNKNCPIFFEDH